MAHLITGYKGEEHIQSADQGSFNASFFGTGQYVMEAGNQMEASIIDNNTVRIVDGDILMKGRHIRIAPNTFEDLSIDTGTAGRNRNDLIVMRYEKNNGSGIELASLVVIKGTETEGTPTDPSYTNGDILAGALVNDMPLYRVKLEGVVLTEVEQLFSTLTSFGALAEKYEQEFIEACNSHLDSLNILDTKEEILANTQTNQLAGALAVKEIANSKQDADTAITTSNIANQSVNYATSAGKATQDQSGNNIKATYGNSLAVSGTTLQLKNKNGAVLSEVNTQDTTYSAATQSANGLMSSADKTKLDGIASGATKNTVTNNLTSTSTTNALSANQGRLLANGSARDSTKLPLTGGNVTGETVFSSGIKVFPELEVDGQHDSSFDINPTITFKCNGWTDGFISKVENQLLTIATNGEGFAAHLGVRNSMWGFFPSKDSVRLGTPSYKWNQIYSTSGTINTSDRNLKKDIESLDDKQTKEFVMKLNPVSYKFKDGESGRTHTGLIAQEVEETLYDIGLSEKDFAGLCKDKKVVDDKETDEYLYGLRYEEFISPLIKMVQLQQKEIEDLKVRIETLEKGK